MTTKQIQEQAETIEATVSQGNANLQEAVQGLGGLVAALCERLRYANASVEELNARANE
jgi:hypothetical protein